MKKYIACPDSFKGTLTSREAGEAIREGIMRGDPSASVEVISIADGGEGTVDALGARRMPLRVTGPDGEPVDSFWGLLEDSSTAVIEMSAAAGLPQTRLKDPERTTTYGVGELMLAALEHGCRSFVFGLGGSATNDAGCGMAASLGARFFDAAGNEFIPTGGRLCDIAAIDLSSLDPRVRASRLRVMCDITNPLYGERGAAYIFAPQKGADEAMVERLDLGLRNFAAVVKRDLGLSVDELAGGGAAGGMGAGCVALLGATLESGINTLLELKRFDALLDRDTVVITGEGKFDGQSIGGKAISGIAARAGKQGAAVVILCGSADEVEQAYELGVTAVFSIQTAARPIERALVRNALDLRITAENIARLISRMSK